MHDSATHDPSRDSLWREEFLSNLCRDRHHDAIGRDTLSVLEDNSLNAVIMFFQMGEAAAAASAASTSATLR